MDKNGIPQWLCVPEEEYKKLQECKPFLRENETPLECIKRHKRNTEVALKMYAKAKKHCKHDR